MVKLGTGKSVALNGYAVLCNGIFMFECIQYQTLHVSIKERRW